MGRKKKTPYDECVWEWVTINSDKYCITSMSYYDRSKYYLWKLIDHGKDLWTKIGDAATPSILYKKYLTEIV